jgi:hypothetical protein
MTAINIHAFSKGSLAMSVPTKIVRSLLAAAMVGAATVAAAALTTASAQAAPPVYSTLIGTGSNKCLDALPDAGNGGPVRLWQCSGSANQRWALYPVGSTKDGDGYFQIISGAAGHLCMEVQQSSTADGAQVGQVGCAQDPNQFWRWGKSGVKNRGDQLININSGKCLDIAANSTVNGAKVQQWSCNQPTSTGQLFAPSRLSGDVSSSPR